MSRSRLSLVWSIPWVAGVVAQGPSSTSSAADLGTYILHGIGASSTTSSHSQVPSNSTSPSGSVTSSSTRTSDTNYPFSKAKIPPVSPVSWSTGVPEPYFEHATRCWTDFIDWYHSWPGYIDSAGISTKVTSEVITAAPETSSTALTIYPSANVGTYELCDGFPRANYTPSTTWTTYTFPAVTETTSSTVVPSIPPQACVPNEQDCEVWWFLSNLGHDRDSPDYGALLGQCGYPLDEHADCVIQGGPVQLLYFPVSTEGGLCATDGKTLTDTNAESVVTALGTTFTSGSVYLSFESLYAAYETIAGPGSGLPLGPTLTSTILAFRSDEISTNCFHGTGKGVTTSQLGTRLNYADLNYPVPASAYKCQNRCQSYVLIPDTTDFSANVVTSTLTPDPCKTIWDDYGPLLAMPTRVSELFPEWSTCRYWNFYQQNLLFDPPSALQQATTQLAPTLPGTGLNPTTAPSPASTPSSFPTATATTNTIPETTAPVAESISPSVQTTPQSTPSAAESTSTTVQTTPSSVPSVAESSSPANTIATDTSVESTASAAESSLTSPTTSPTTPITSSDIGSEPSSGSQGEASSTSGSEEVPTPVPDPAPTQSDTVSSVASFSYDPVGSTDTLGDDPGTSLTFASDTGVASTGPTTTEVMVVASETATVEVGPENTIAIVDGTTLSMDGPAVTTDGTTNAAKTSGSTAVSTERGASTTAVDPGESSIIPSTGLANPGVGPRVGTLWIAAACLLAVF